MNANPIPSNDRQETRVCAGKAFGVKSAEALHRVRAANLEVEAAASVVIEDQARVVLRKAVGARQPKRLGMRIVRQRFTERRG